ncbi:hypothetical protein SK128_000205, partial [Halocaridina rubra]
MLGISDNFHKQLIGGNLGFRPTYRCATACLLINRAEMCPCENTGKKATEKRIAIRAQLENVTNLEATGDDFQYCLRIKCNGCNEEADKWQFISADEQIKMPGSQGSTNFLIKCKICRKTNSV